MAESNPYDQARYILTMSDQVTTRNRPRHSAYFHTTITGLPTDPAVISMMASLRDAIAANVSVDTILDRFKFSPAGTNITYPVAIPDAVGGNSDHIPDDQPWSLGVQFVARTSHGHPSSLTIYDNLIVDDAAERLSMSAAPAWANAIYNYLNTTPSIIGADGGGLVWYPYINLIGNKYWRRKARQG